MVSKRDFLSSDVKSRCSLAFSSHGTRVHKDHKTTVTLHGGSAFSRLSFSGSVMLFPSLCALALVPCLSSLSLHSSLPHSLASALSSNSPSLNHYPATLTKILLPYLLSYPPPLPLFLLQLPFFLASPFPRKRNDGIREGRRE